MAYPYLIDAGLRIPRDSTHNQRFGPFFYGSKRFAVLLDWPSATIEVWSSSNRGQTWAEEDATDHPAIETSVPNVDQVEFGALSDGTRIYIVFNPPTFPSPSILAIARFNMQTEQWESTFSGGPEVELLADFHMARRDRTGVIVWEGARENVGGNNRDRIYWVRVNLDTGSWSVAANLLGAGEDKDYLQSGVCEDGAGRVYVQMYTFDWSGGPSIYRLEMATIRTDNSVSTPVVLSTEASPDTFTQGQLYGTDDEVLVSFVEYNSGGGVGSIRVASATPADSPSWSTVTAWAFDNTGFGLLLFAGSNGAVGIAKDTSGRVWLTFWAAIDGFSGSSMNLLYAKRVSGNWQSPTLIANLTINSISQHSMGAVQGRVGSVMGIHSGVAAAAPWYWEGGQGGVLSSLGDSVR